MPQKLVHVDKSHFYNLYIVQNKTQKQVAEELGVSLSVVADRVVRFGLKKNKRYKFDHSVFSSYNPASCYWAGFIGADGCIGLKTNAISIQLKSTDEGHLKGD